MRAQAIRLQRTPATKTKTQKRTEATMNPKKKRKRASATTTNQPTIDSGAGRFPDSLSLFSFIAPPSSPAAYVSESDAETLERMRNEIDNVAYWTRAPALTAKEREAAAWIGAMRAVRTYNPNKGASLNTWVQIKAKYAIEDEARREQRQRRRFGKAYGITYAIPQYDASPDDELAEERRARISELVRYALDSLDKRTRDIIERVWYCGDSQEEIARAYGFSQSWCSRLYRRGMARIKEILAPFFTSRGGYPNID